MGGSGSGRRQRYQRRTTEGYLALDIAVLRRRGLLQPGCSGTIAWSRGGERIGSASLFAESGSLRLSYQTTTSEGSAERIDERIEIWSTQTSLGGQRQWFRCPGCHRQCRILYGGPRFRCRLVPWPPVRMPVREPRPARQPARPQDPTPARRLRLPDGRVSAQAAAACIGQPIVASKLWRRLRIISGPRRSSRVSDAPRDATS